MSPIAQEAAAQSQQMKIRIKHITVMWNSVVLNDFIFQHNQSSHITKKDVLKILILELQKDEVHLHVDINSCRL